MEVNSLRVGRYGLNTPQCLHRVTIGIIKSTAVLIQFANHVPKCGIYMSWQAAVLAVAMCLGRRRFELHPNIMALTDVQISLQ